MGNIGENGAGMDKFQILFQAPVPAVVLLVSSLRALLFYCVLPMQRGLIFIKQTVMLEMEQYGSPASPHQALTVKVAGTLQLCTKEERKR